MKIIKGDRRAFIKFMGQGLALATLSPLVTLSGCASSSLKTLKNIPPSFDDKFIISEGFSWELLLSWGDLLNERGDTFGFNNDYIAYIPLNNNEAILWVNHEYLQPLFVSGYNKPGKKTKEQTLQEMKVVGGSLNHIKNINGKWQLVKNSEYNRRLDARTPIPFSNNIEINGSKIAQGTFSNCAGGVTPWQSVLSCEENYDNFVGEIKYDKDKKPSLLKSTHEMNWHDHFNYDPEHYGWVVEINPKNGNAKKLVSLGRFPHEGAACVTAKDGRVVVYMGEDRNDGRFFKFVSKNRDNLDEGTLYVANLEKGQWIPLDLTHPLLKKEFDSQTRILVRASYAAEVVGGTPLDRPEDCEIHPQTGEIYLNCTNNIPAGRPFGSIYKFKEKGDYDSLSFEHSVFILGGEQSGIACPDNLAIDKNGHLWMTNDISESKIGEAPYEAFGNNALFYIPTSGQNAGTIYRIAQAPKDAELTGPCFSEDGKTLFLSVQHPGAKTRSLDKLTGNWPHGGNQIPRPSVIAINIPEQLR